jgi:ribosome-associated protein
MKTPKELALLAARALSDKKGKEIRVMEIAELTTLADYFVLATGASNTQINALVDNVEKVLAEEAGEQPLHREGYRGGTWVLLDYGCIAIHVFNQEARAFYGLERLWQDGKSVDRTHRTRVDERRHRRARMKCFRRFSRKTGLTFGKNALK